MRHLLIVLLITSISACGFHLRGQLPLSESNDVVYVDARQSEFSRDLEKRLTISGATLVDDATAAKITLKIDDLTLERVTNTLDDRGKVNSFILVYAVKFSIIGADEKVIKSNSLQESRSYTFDVNQILQQEREEEELEEEMRKELVLRLVRQLSVL